MAANRFAHKQRRALPVRLLLSLALFCLVLYAFGIGLDSISSAADAESLKSAREAVTNAAVHCYAVEGVYPPSLDYLEKHYGLWIDRERYQVHYSCFASNLFPDITVLPRTGETGGGVK